VELEESARRKTSTKDACPVATEVSAPTVIPAALLARDYKERTIPN
jgi:hypothetical protein